MPYTPYTQNHIHTTLHTTHTDIHANTYHTYTTYIHYTHIPCNTAHTCNATHTPHIHHVHSHICTCQTQPNILTHIAHIQTSHTQTHTAQMYLNRVNCEFTVLLQPLPALCIQTCQWGCSPAGLEKQNLRQNLSNRAEMAAERLCHYIPSLGH